MSQEIQLRRLPFSFFSHLIERIILQLRNTLWRRNSQMADWELIQFGILVRDLLSHIRRSEVTLNEEIDNLKRLGLFRSVEMILPENKLETDILLPPLLLFSLAYNSFLFVAAHGKLAIDLQCRKNGICVQLSGMGGGYKRNPLFVGPWKTSEEMLHEFCHLHSYRYSMLMTQGGWLLSLQQGAFVDHQQAVIPFKRAIMSLTITPSLNPSSLKKGSYQERMEWKDGIDKLTRSQLTEWEIRQKLDVVERDWLILREQLKPHFIANCINSIRNLVIREEWEKADQYLTRLSGFLCLVHDVNGRSSVNLGEELEILRLYLDLEQLRFRSRFAVVYAFGEDLDLNLIKVPPLLLQPFAENAVKHAFAEDKADQVLRIGVERTSEGKKYCFLEDNGVGLVVAQNRKSLPHAEEKGMGMQLSFDRLRFFNQRFQTNYSIRIIDLQAVRQSTGVRVEIHFE